MTDKRDGINFLSLLAFFALALMVLPFSAQAQVGRSEADPVTGQPMFPGVAYSGPASPSGDLSTCGGTAWNNRTDTSISGGRAGLSAPGNACFSGGGQSFCATMSSYNYTCTDLGVTQSTPPVDVLWVPFDVAEGELDRAREDEFYTGTTRDDNRGRAGYNSPLFMNKFGVCRSVDNSARSINPVFMGVSTEAEWRTVHGVPAGGNPNRQTEGGSGYNAYTNDASIPVGFQTCCSPVLVTICGQQIPTGYANVGDTASITAAQGFAQIQCVANNTWRALNVEGICDGGGGGGGGSENGRGFSNPRSPGGIGEISAERWDSLPSSTQNQLRAQGYGEVSRTTPTNQRGIADISSARAAAAAARTAAEAEAARIKAENERLLEEARRAAEEAERRAQEEAANDDDETT